MLTRIFATSKPLNYLLVSGYVFLVFIIDYFLNRESQFELLDLLSNALAACVLVFSILLVDFIVRKNQLSRTNTFIILCYGLLLALLPLEKTVWGLLVAQLFVLFALRRVLSLGSQKRTVKKLYDAGLWLAVASLFYFGAGLYIATVFVGIIFLVNFNFKHWLLPVFGLLTVLFLYTTGHWVFFDRLPSWKDWYVAPDFDFSQWKDQLLSLIPAVFVGLSLLSGLLFFSELRKTLFKFKKVQLYCLSLLIVGLAIVILGPKSQIESWIMLSFPLAVIMGNVIQEHQQRLISEIFLWAMVLSPFVLRFLL